MGGNYVWGDFCSISDRRLVFSVKCRSRSASDSDQEQTPTSSALGLVVLFLSFTVGPDFPRAIFLAAFGQIPLPSHGNLFLRTSNDERCLSARVDGQ